MAEKYSWLTGHTVLSGVQLAQAEWRAIAGKAASISTGYTNKWMGIVSCHREIRSGDEYIRFPTEKELLYTALGPIAHGGQGTLFFLFESGWGDVNTVFYGVYDDTSRRSYVQNAITRMSAVSDLLNGATYQAYASSTALPSGWSLDSISSGDTSNEFNILEVCRWTGPSAANQYVLCNRDPANAKTVTTNFDQVYSIYVDGVFKTHNTTYQFSIPTGDVAVVKVALV